MKAKPKGKTPKLSPEQFEKLKALLLEGSLKHGFETDNWTRERIAGLIATEFGIGYHVSHVSKLMQKMGFSLQKPVHHSYRKNDGDVSKWVGETLPALKKSPSR